MHARTVHIMNHVTMCPCRESALAEMGIAVRKGETVGVFQPKKVNSTIPYQESIDC